MSSYLPVSKHGFLLIPNSTKETPVSGINVLVPLRPHQENRQFVFHYLTFSFSSTRSPNGTRTYLFEISLSVAVPPPEQTSRWRFCRLNSYWKVLPGHPERKGRWREEQQTKGGATSGVRESMVGIPSKVSPMLKKGSQASCISHSPDAGCPQEKGASSQSRGISLAEVSPRERFGS